MVWALGGPSFALRTPRALVYLDPYFGDGPADPAVTVYRTLAVPLDPEQLRWADAVLISHAHFDHCHGPTISAMLKSTDVVFYGPSSAIAAMRECGVPRSRMQLIEHGDRFEMRDVAVTVVQGHDEGDAAAVVYLLEAAGVRLLFAGDSLDGPSLDHSARDGRLDVAMLAFGRTWYMNEEQALAVATRLRPRVLIPYHWELWRGYTGDPVKLGRLAERQRVPFDIHLLLLGDYLHFRPDGQVTRGV